MCGQTAVIEHVKGNPVHAASDTATNDDGERTVCHLERLANHIRLQPATPPLSDFSVFPLFLVSLLRTLALVPHYSSERTMIYASSFVKLKLRG